MKAKNTTSLYHQRQLPAFMRLLRDKSVLQSYVEEIQFNKIDTESCGLMENIERKKFSISREKIKVQLLLRKLR
jgi:hypothetical protein